MGTRVSTLVKIDCIKLGSWKKKKTPDFAAIKANLSIGINTKVSVAFVPVF